MWVCVCGWAYVEGAGTDVVTLIVFTRQDHSAVVSCVGVMVIITHTVYLAIQKMTRTIITLSTSVQAGAVLMPLAMICFRSKV